MAMRIYNTLSRKEDELVSGAAPGTLGVYVCGPTVYDLSHVGHARVYVIFDTVVRYLRHHFAVKYVRNFTDVDDKIIKRANASKQDPLALSQHFIEEFRVDMEALECLPPDVEPKVSDHIAEIVAMIRHLVDSGAAYAANGDVYYAVEKFATYGRLGRRTLEDMEAGARVEVSAQKRHPMDFALWKTAKPGEPAWESPWGQGRPGWHIECSAMSQKYLGDTFDIHGGGRDLIFPHHENEIAQSEATTGQQMARVWMHNGLVNIDNEKMSKSLGNFFTIRDVLHKFDAQTLRFYLLSTHYRSPINFSDASLREADNRVKYFYETLNRLLGALTPGEEGPPYRSESVGDIVGRFDAAMSDDFNTPKAIGDLSEIFKLVNDVLAHPGDADTDGRTLRAVHRALKEIGGVLGLFLQAPSTVLENIAQRRKQGRDLDVQAVERLIAERTEARKNKDFKRADDVRVELTRMGVAIKDAPTGTTWEVV